MTATSWLASSQPCRESQTRRWPTPTWLSSMTSSRTARSTPAKRTPWSSLPLAGLDRKVVTELHASYLRSLARAAWEDGVIEAQERRDLGDVAVLLGLALADVDAALEAALAFTGDNTPAGTLRLHPGDRVCFTGQMSQPRAELAGLAADAGLEVCVGVSKKTTMLICADADSMSGKARKARDLGVIVISEPKFHLQQPGRRRHGAHPARPDSRPSHLEPP